MINYVQFIFLGTLGWGVSLYLTKTLLIFLSPVDVVLYRMGIGFFALFCLVKLLRIPVDNYKYLIKDGLVLGTFNMSIPFYLTTYAVTHTPSSLAAVMNGLTPIFTFLLGVSFFTIKPKINFFNVLSIFLGLLGVIVINIDFSLGEGRILDLLALVATTFSYGIAANYVKSFAKTKEPILLATMAAFFSALIMLILKMINHDLSNWHTPQNLQQVLILLWLGVVGSGISLYLYCVLIRKLGPVIASMVTYLMTITGVTMGVIFLHEKISNLTMLGCCFIIFALVLINHANQLQIAWSSFFYRARRDYR